MPWWQMQDLMFTSAAILGGLIVITGLTLRFGIRPFLSELRAARQEAVPSESSVQLARIEQRLDDLETSIKRLVEVTQFDRQLGSGSSSKGAQSK